MAEHHYGLRMRQSLTHFEQSFLLQSERDQRQAEEIARTVEARARARRRARETRASSLRFYLLAASLVLTAVVVTALMLATLYVLLV